MQVCFTQSIQCCFSTRCIIHASHHRPRVSKHINQLPVFICVISIYAINRMQPHLTRGPPSHLAPLHCSAHILTLHKSLGSCFCMSSLTIRQPPRANSALKYALLLLKLHPSKSTTLLLPPLPVNTFSLSTMTPVGLRQVLRRASSGTRSSSVT